MCPCHASEFDLRTGDVLCPPALEPLPIYEARIEEGELQVRLAPPPAAAEAVHEREDHVSETVARAATTSGPSVAGLVLDDVDLNDLDAWEQGVPYEWLTLLRREAPLFWQPEVDGRGYWVFTRYDDIVQVSKDWEAYSSELGGTSLEDLTPEEVEARKSMLDTDPPAHTRLRALVNKGFTPRVVNTYEERIRGLAQGILAQAFERDELRLGRGRRLRDPDVGLLGIGTPGRRPAAPDRARRQAARQHRPRRGRRGERPRPRGDPSLDPAAAVLEPVRRRPDRVRLPARCGPAPRSARRRHDAARRGRDRRLAPDRARVRAVLHPAHDGRQGDDAAHDQPRPDRPAREPGRARAAGRRSEPRGHRADEILRRAHPVHHFRRTASRDVAVHGRRIKAGER